MLQACFIYQDVYLKPPKCKQEMQQLASVWKSLYFLFEHYDTKLSKQTLSPLNISDNNTKKTMFYNI